jgi:hypothetical protein
MMVPFDCVTVLNVGQDGNAMLACTTGKLAEISTESCKTGTSRNSIGTVR